MIIAIGIDLAEVDRVRTALEDSRTGRAFVTACLAVTSKRIASAAAPANIKATLRASRLKRRR